MSFRLRFRTLYLCLAITLVLGGLNPPLAQSKSFCFAKLISWFKPASALELAQQSVLRGHLQEAVFLFKKAGDVDRAAALENQIQRSLRDEDIVSSELLGTGSSSPELITTQSGVRAVKKLDRAFDGANANSEVAVYALDQYFDGVFNVPVTVKRTLNGKTYSLQAYVETAQIGLPSDTSPNLEFLDFIIDNTDRFGGTNLLLTKEKIRVPIDHGLGFRTSESLRRGWHQKESPWSRVLALNCYDKYSGRMNRKCMQEIVVQSLPDRAVYKKFKETSDAEFTRLFSSLLDEDELKIFLKRKAYFIGTAEEYLKTNGYPVHRKP